MVGEKPNFFMNIMIWNLPVETTKKKDKNNDWLSGTRMYQASKGYQFLKFFMQVTYHSSRTRPNFTLKKNSPFKVPSQKKQLLDVCERYDWVDRVPTRVGPKTNYK